MALAVDPLQSLALDYERKRETAHNSDAYNAYRDAKGTLNAILQNAGVVPKMYYTIWFSDEKFNTQCKKFLKGETNFLTQFFYAEVKRPKEEVKRCYIVMQSRPDYCCGKNCEKSIQISNSRSVSNSSTVRSCN